MGVFAAAGVPGNLYPGFLILMTLVIIVLAALAAIWLWNRPTIKRDQLRIAKNSARVYKSRAEEYEEIFRRIQDHVDKTGDMDAPLATLIELELEPFAQREEEIIKKEKQ